MLGQYAIPLPFALGVLGALIGSFLNVVIVRLPDGRSVVHPPSSCPKCGDRIPPWLNIPIVSWLILRGRCRRCRVVISPRYPIVELLTALLFIAVGQRFGPTPATAAGLLLVSGLVAVTFIDIDHFEIPDEISIWGTVLGCFIRPWAFDVPWWSGLVGAALGAGFLMIVRVSYQLLRKQEGMGLGDVKLLAMIGAFLGAGSLLPVILIASTLGSIYGLGLVAVEQFQGGDGEPLADEPTESSTAPREEAADHDRSEATSSESDAAPRFIDEDGEEWVPPKYALPFGPFLALGAVTVLLFAPTLQRWIVLLRT